MPNGGSRSSEKRRRIDWSGVVPRIWSRKGEFSVGVAASLTAAGLAAVGGYFIVFVQGGGDAPENETHTEETVDAEPPTSPFIAVSGGAVDKAWNGVEEGSRYLGSHLRRGDTLGPGEYIASESLLTVLYMEDDGNVVLATKRRIIWETGTSGRGASQLKLEADGNLEIQAADGTALWDPQYLPDKAGPAEPGAFMASTATAQLVVEEDGNLVAYNSPDHAADGKWWEAGTAGRGSQLTLIGGANLTAGMELGADEYIHNLDTSTPHMLVLQGDGNLVIYSPGQVPVWSSETDTLDVVRVVVEQDGDVVFLDPDGRAVAHTDTGGNPDAFLRLGGDGNLVVYAREPGDDRPIWSRLDDELTRVS